MIEEISQKTKVCPTDFFSELGQMIVEISQNRDSSNGFFFRDETGGFFSEMGQMIEEII